MRRNNKLHLYCFFFKVYNGILKVSCNEIVIGLICYSRWLDFIEVVDVLLVNLIDNLAEFNVMFD